MKILFLDFDGVITTYESRYNIQLEKLKLIGEIIKRTDCKIVISSSWAVGCSDISQFIRNNRLSTLSQYQDTKYIIDSFIDVTDHSSGLPNRGDEIQDWLDKHESEVESYCIIDDDSDMLSEQLFNFVQTDTYEGITMREVKLCTQILNNQKVINPTRLNHQLYYLWRLKCDGYNNEIDNLLREYNLLKKENKL